MIGQTLSHFKITAKLGEGGMGEVYRAEDTKLGREVAIKVLPEAFTEDPERFARFEREAHVLASLNHPNIATIYDLAEDQGTHFLVLELAEGEDLAARLARGAIPIKDALPLALQIAEALEAAHEKGIVHRDLKPANVMVSPDGKVKVLDFGLAKPGEVDPGESDSLSMSPTLTAQMTQAGTILGTAAYMSPEQARGQQVDKQTDIWALGVVLFEMLTGERMFAGKTATDTIAAIIEREPDWSALPPATPSLVRSLLRRCLEKDRSRRLHDVADARIEIAEVGSDADVVISPHFEQAPQRRQAKGVLGALVGVALGGLIAGLAVWASLQPEAKAVLRFAITSSDVFPTGFGPLLAISADSETLVYSAERDGVAQLFLHSRDQFETSPIAGTERGQAPSISPDGEWIAFVVRGTGILQKVSLAGGPPVTLCEGARGSGVSWGPDDTIVFTHSSRKLFSIPASGGEPRQVTDLEGDETVHRGVTFLPGGKEILFAALSGSRETTTIMVHSLETGERRPLLDGTHPRYISTGHLVFARSNALWAAPFDADELRLTGEPIPVVDGVRQEAIGAAQFAIADDGTLAYLPAHADSAGQHSLRWADRAGAVTPLTTERRSYRRLSISPSGEELVLGITGKDGRDNIWLLDVERGTLTSLTSDDTLNLHPVWAPDGTRIAFSSAMAVDKDIYWIALNTSDVPQPLFLKPGHQSPSSWSHDGKLLAFNQLVQGNKADIWILSLQDGTASAFIATHANEYGAVFSPDSRWVAYGSEESGRSEIYIRPYATGRSIQVSPDGGREPRWAASGMELFYLNANDEIVAVPVMAADSLELGQPERLFQVSNILDYDIHPDGERFAVLQRGDASLMTTEIKVVVNWFEDIKRLVPTNS